MHLGGPVLGPQSRSRHLCCPRIRGNHSVRQVTNQNTRAEGQWGQRQVRKDCCFLAMRQASQLSSWLVFGICRMGGDELLHCNGGFSELSWAEPGMGATQKLRKERHGLCSQDPPVKPRHSWCPQTTGFPQCPALTQRHCSRAAAGVGCGYGSPSHSPGVWVVIPAGGTPESAPGSHLCLLGCLLPG